VFLVDGADNLSGPLSLVATQAAATAGLFSARPTAVQSASGTLTPGDAAAIPLAGTYDGTTFNVTGGGYSITATVNAATLSGTGKAPTGQVANVTGAGGAVSTAPAGTYSGTYSSTTLWTYSNSRDGVGCMWIVQVAGTLVMKVSGTPDKLTAEWSDRFTETEVNRFSCPFAFNGGGLKSEDWDYSGASPIRLAEIIQSASGGVSSKGITNLQAEVITGVGMVGTINHQTYSLAAAVGPGPAGNITSTSTATANFTLKKE